jgi:hypothetical protein
LPAVALVFAPVHREFNARCEKNRGTGPEPVSVLANGGLQVGEDRPRHVRAFRGNRFSTEFADAIIEATSAAVIEKEIQFGDRRIHSLNIMIPTFSHLL